MAFDFYGLGQGPGQPGQPSPFLGTAGAFGPKGRSGPGMAQKATDWLASPIGQIVGGMTVQAIMGQHQDTPLAMAGKGFQGIGGSRIAAGAAKERVTEDKAFRESLLKAIGGVEPEVTPLGQPGLDKKVIKASDTGVTVDRTETLEAEKGDETQKRFAGKTISGNWDF